MDIDLLKILFNSGLFVLIWIVQLVIYPSFCFYTEERLKIWHRSYTVRISIVVLPLMLGQLLFYLYSAFNVAVVMDYALLFLVILTWLITFLISVPLHDKIEKKTNTIKYREQLVKTNWFRTLLWSLIFIISLSNYAK